MLMWPADSDQTTPLDRRIRHDAMVRENIAKMWVVRPQMSESAIGKKVGLTKGAVRGLVSRMGLPPRPNPAAKAPNIPHRSPITITPPSEWTATNRHVPTLAEALRDSETLRALASC